MTDIDRRKFLAAVGATGVAASVAGCAGDMEDGNNSTDSDVPQGPPTPPPGVMDQDNDTWQYVVDSLQYQNAVLQRLDD